MDPASRLLTSAPLCSVANLSRSLLRARPVSLCSLASGGGKAQHGRPPPWPCQAGCASRGAPPSSKLLASGAASCRWLGFQWLSCCGRLAAAQLGYSPSSADPGPPTQEGSFKEPFRLPHCRSPTGRDIFYSWKICPVWRPQAENELEFSKSRYSSEENSFHPKLSDQGDIGTK